MSELSRPSTPGNPRSRAAKVARTVIVLLALLFVIVSVSKDGFAGALTSVGLLAAIFGAVRVLFGRRSEPSGARKRGAGILLAGVVALVAGSVLSPAAAAPAPAQVAAPVQSPQTSAVTTTGVITTTTTIVDAEPGTALAELATLDVKGRAPKTGYDRALFGQTWADVDRNGCDTRNDILVRDLTDEIFKLGTNDCVVLSGSFTDPYTGKVIAFVRGNDTSPLVQIDHVVALSDAWQKGAQGWDETTRTAFANDPLNLLAVDGSTNQAKGDGDAATWLPPNKSYRCAYVARQVAVKAKYDAWVTSAERDAIAGILAACPAEPLPVDIAAVQAAQSAAAESSAAHAAQDQAAQQASADQAAADQAAADEAAAAAAAAAEPTPEPETDCDIKGNISKDGEKIYHVPGGRSYDATVITPSKGERMFCSIAEAEAEGWRAARG